MVTGKEFLKEFLVSPGFSGGEFLGFQGIKLVFLPRGPVCGVFEPEIIGSLEEPHRGDRGLSVFWGKRR